MPPPEDERLHSALRSALAGRRAAVMGVGNLMRGDDGFGPAVVERLRALLGRAVPSSEFRAPSPDNPEPGTRPSTPLGALSLSKGNPEPDLAIIDAGSAPENFTGPVRRHRPEVVLMLDAGDFGGRPGELRLLGPAELSGGSPATHANGLSLLFGYLRAECGAEGLVLCAQAGAVELGAPMGPEVTGAVERAAGLLKAVLAEGGDAGDGSRA